MTLPHTQTIKLGAVELAYHERGDAGSPALLLLHGLGSSSSTWGAVAESFADTHRVLSLDLRGHGRSTWTSTYLVDDMADDVAGFLDMLGVTGVSVIAHSMGAMVAYVLAERWPDRVGRLLLEDPPPPVPATPPRVSGERPAGELDYDWRIQDDFSRQRNAPPSRWQERLTDIRAATLIIRGSRSHIPAAAVEQMAARIPHCRVVALDAGHDVHEDAPDEFLHHATAFMAV
ncbi:alpha/beta fold hydrolase [Spirillospora sp. NPDC049024]